jgi:hypothetical protein
MDRKHEKIKERDLFYCFVHINTSHTRPPKDSFRFFIVPSTVVAKYVREEHQAWLRDDPTHRTSPRRLFRIGFRNDRKIKAPAAPLAEAYEDKWNLL